MTGVLKRFSGQTVRRNFVIGVPMVWMGVFFLLPFVIVFKISLTEAQISIPPYAPILEFLDDSIVQIRLHFSNYAFLVEDAIYARALWSSVKIAALSTVVALLLAYPVAWGITRLSSFWRNIMLFLTILPFWTSFLIRVYAWIGILKKQGLLNSFLLWLGIIEEPLGIFNTAWAVGIGIVYSYLPFMILPLYAALERIDSIVLEAAKDLGARNWVIFLHIIIPLSLPGVVAGCLLVFIPAIGEFIIPELLGGSDTLMIGRVLWQEFLLNRDWPVAASVAICLLVLVVMPLVLIHNRAAKKEAVL